ncbi:hypothetical protein AB204_12430 [Xenorhabdus khoisanae]|uniref:Uncharacterized protein n=1 Tax=Xenorhabdus khoisanae TaxID=880157 RepID=A0A0J5INJ1_9GAMM|nr:hypothetical protein [Xenorhabdus khoisanae]KMJ44790.1 hypothetical protein AB204_12430 [Xenorhabdus khoisanae]
MYDEDDEMSFKEIFDIFLLNKFNMTRPENLLPLQKNKALQRPAERKSIFLLEKTEKYFLRNWVTGKLKLADGLYIFVITADDPHTIYCARSVRDSNYHWYDAVDGHSSIGYREPVRYAGSILFDQGELSLWTNASGHYRPPQELRYLMTPYIRHLLPDTKFRRISF